MDCATGSIRLFYPEATSPMATISQVAERAGVSSSTVSHAINNTRFVSNEAQFRVQQAMEELGYQPNALARLLRRGETRTLGLILPDSSNPFFAETAQDLETAAFDLGYSLILCNAGDSPTKERLYLDVLLQKRVDGLILSAKRCVGGARRFSPGVGLLRRPGAAQPARPSHGDPCMQRPDQSAQCAQPASWD